MRGYKCLTHDRRSPIQGGPVLWDGSLPYDLPVVTVDDGPDECAAGWNYCATPEDALRIGGLWPTGWPSRVYEVDDHDLGIARDDKRRAPTLTVLRELGEDEIGAAVRRLSDGWFGGLAEEMAAEQMAWRAALARPQRDPTAVEAGLCMALDRRGLGGKWTLRRFDDARAAWAAWAARDARDARAARDAWAALTVFYAARCGWTRDAPDLLAVGVRDAYRASLALAVPTGPTELGWAMVEEPEQMGLEAGE